MDDNGSITGRISGKELLPDCLSTTNNVSWKDDGDTSSLQQGEESTERQGKEEVDVGDGVDGDRTTGIRKTTIYDLPRQLWLDINEFIDYSTYLNLRLTSRHFLHLVDEYIGIRVNFSKASDENPEIFNFFTAVALNDVQFEDASDSEKYSFPKLIKYPGFLTDISFIGPTNLGLIQEILLNCQCLQLVELTMDCKILRDTSMTLDDAKKILPKIDVTSLAPPSTSYLKQVECLKLVPGVQSDDNLRSHLVLSILRATRAANHLRKVIFQCELSQEITLVRVLTITLELMERHPKLEALFLALLNDEYLMLNNNNQNPNESRTMTYMDLENPEQLEHFRRRIQATGRYLKIKKMGLAMLNSSMKLIWTDFLRTQHRLVHLSLTVTIENGTFSEEIFNSFSETLEQLAIRGKFEVAFDFQHLSNCLKLKEVCLHNLQENGGGGIVPKCTNLPQVSDSLESLILFQVVSRTEEIRETLRKLEKLHTLVLFKCGHAAGETGVGLTCLREILNKRSLQSILMVQFICESTAEAEALAGILFDLAQHTENQATHPMRRRRIIPEDDEALGQEVVNEELNLPEIEDGGDNLLFPLINRRGRAEAAAPVEGAQAANVVHDDQETEEGVDLNFNNLQEDIPPRPVSRGNHRGHMEEIEEYRRTLSSSSQNPSSLHGGDNDVSQAEFILQMDDFPPLNLPAGSEETGENVSLEVEAMVGNNEPVEVVVEVAENDVNNNNIENNFNMVRNLLEAFAEDRLQRVQNEEFQNQNVAHEVEVVVDIDVAEDELGNLPVLDLFAAEQLAREHNVQVGFILDGVIDIMNEEVVRSKWLCVEDGEGHITYTLKISVEL